MITQLLLATTTILGGCNIPITNGLQAPTALTESPTEMPDCPNDQVFLLDHITDPTNCDLNPPTILAAILDDDPAAFQLCLDYGGQTMHDPAIDRFYCIDLDY